MQWEYWQFLLSDIRSIELSLEKEPSEKSENILGGILVKLVMHHISVDKSENPCY